MRFWRILIIASGCLAIYEDLAVKFVELLRKAGVVNERVFENGSEPVRILAFAVLLISVVAFTVWYYNKHREFFWNSIINS
ncbi:MAG: hypothetical protein IKE38_05350 [Erysipelotrichaceae bacterium]|nr:hypothetical protein [Erysipelotrichaceae bacterium]